MKYKVNAYSNAHQTELMDSIETCDFDYVCEFVIKNSQKDYTCEIINETVNLDDLIMEQQEQM